MKDAGTLEGSDLADVLEERNRALLTLDIAHVRKQLGHPGLPEHTALMVLHKARYECLAIPREFRNYSRAWLAQHGYKRMTGEPLLPEGELPE